LSKDFGIPVLGEWALTEFTIRITPTNPPPTQQTKKSIFFRADGTLSFFSSPTAASDGTWKLYGDMITWQYKPQTWGAVTPPPDTYWGNKIGMVMMGRMQLTRRPNQFTEGEGYWCAVKV
jgi:hypothetical protein